MKIRLFAMILSSSFFLIACNDDVKELEVIVPVPAPELEIKRDVNLREFSRGQKLYQKNCAVCHGKNGEGNPDWRKVDEDGKFPAPPLNGTGHTWHHSTKVLVDTIKNGTAKIGGNMPAWKDKLSNQEINDILTWVKALWPDEIYATWYNRFHQEK